MLPSYRDYAVIPEFVTIPEHAILLDWAEQEYAHDRLHPNGAGPGRYFARYDPGDNVPSDFWNIRTRAIEAFDVKDYEDEPMFKCFLGCNTEGGFVHRHKDPAKEGTTHVRMNLVLSLPVKGGIPVIEGNPLSVKERDLWCFHPSFMWHSSTPVVGPKKRFIISIGLLVPLTNH